jgi:hypothetical protein
MFFKEKIDDNIALKVLNDLIINANDYENVDNCIDFKIINKNTCTIIRPSGYQLHIFVPIKVNNYELTCERVKQKYLNKIQKQILKIHANNEKNKLYNEYIIKIKQLVSNI